jgi:hypothetical protein
MDVLAEPITVTVSVASNAPAQASGGLTRPAKIEYPQEENAWL